MYSKPVLNYR